MNLGFYSHFIINIYQLTHQLW